MTTQEEHIQMIVTVLLPNHTDQEHIYDFPSGTPAKEALEQVQAIRTKIAETLVLQFPCSASQSAHKLSVNPHTRNQSYSTKPGRATKSY